MYGSPRRTRWFRGTVKRSGSIVGNVFVTVAPVGDSSSRGQAPPGFATASNKASRLGR